MTTLTDIQNAAEILHGVVHVTPVLTSRTLNQTAGATVFLKCENFQRVGAFKFRGAYHAIAMLPPPQRAGPILTISSGNHAQGVALACQHRGMAAHIVMTKPINPLKRQAVRDYHATIHEVADGEQAERKLRDLQEQLNGVYIHAFNDPRVIAGQRTAMLEVLSAVPDLDAVLAPDWRGRIAIRHLYCRPRVKILHSGLCLRTYRSARRGTFRAGKPDCSDDRPSHDCRRTADQLG